ncbi:MFS transporter [Demequina sediminicola]|uniref:MFS transporter n=1 Tax=Demequina sediminicola TaxID=1095026 RepID=UPI000783AA21|nr:MFS transporter [Demequina sediminicola]
MPLVPAGHRSWGFWLVTLAATANYAVLAATAPLLNRAIPEHLGYDTAAAGAFVAIAGFTGMAAMPLLGYLAGRFGPRRITITAAIIATIGIAVATVAFTAPGLITSRIAYGIGNAGITVATTAWVSASSPPESRGRALGYYGMSVWLGLALGPMLSENAYATVGNHDTWAALLAAQTLTLVIAVAVRSGLTESVPPKSAPSPRKTSVRRAVAVPAAIAIAAWGAQGVLTAFLISHLEDRGISPTGFQGGATVLLVFAGSVLIARVTLATATDRLGPTRAARIALGLVALGLGGLAGAPTFVTACLAAVILGFGYAPLYPSLTILATQPLSGPDRATAIGWFSAATSAGMAAGALVGGWLIVSVGSAATIGLCAVAQLAVLPLLKRQGPRGASLATHR